MKEASLLRQPSTSGAESMPAALGQVLASKTFEKTPALRALLEYLWRQRDFAVSEYAIATEALGRSSSFDPRIDATVRVQISRLRQRLDKFYEEEGRNCPERLIIPLGSHRIETELRPLAPPQDLAPSAVVVTPSFPALPAVYRTMHRDLGEPTLSESYTVTSDTFASVELVRYLDQAGLGTSITSSADAPLEALDSENVVALGTWGTLTPLKPYLQQMS